MSNIHQSRSQVEKNNSLALQVFRERSKMSVFCKQTLAMVDMSLKHTHVDFYCLI